MKKVELLILTIIIIGFAIGAYYYPVMPERMASHWNVSNAADGYMPKAWAIFFMPGLSLVLMLVFLAIPKIDPLKRNFNHIKEYYERFIVILFAFLLYLQILVVEWNLGNRFNMIQMLSPAFAILFYYAGDLTGKAKRNWFIGIRTPWTLSSEKVWNTVHKKGGRIFKACGVIALAGIIVPDYAIFFVIIPVLAASIYLIAYSYHLYTNDMKKKKRRR